MGRGLLAGLIALALGAPQVAAADAPQLRPTGRSSLIARILRPTWAHSAPAGSAPVRARIGPRADWAGGAVGLMVLDGRRARGRLWLKVALPSRPNGATGWIDRDVVRLVRTHWRVVVRVDARRLSLLHDGRLVLTTRVVVGAPATPTPRGLFAVYERVRQAPGAVVGPWALHLTAHSRVLHAYDGGPGRIALHGREGGLLADPLGTAASHGCVRMRSAVIRRLAADLVPGTPVHIRARG